MQLVRTAQSKHKINLPALSTEDGGPYVVATWYVVLIVCSSCVPLNSNTNTSSHSPRRTGGPQPPASGALVNTTICLIDWLLTSAGVESPVHGHEVEKHHSEGKNVRRTLHTERKRKWYKKYSERATSPNKQEEKRKKETRMAIGSPAYRRTIERRAAASKKAYKRKRSKTKQT